MIQGIRVDFDFHVKKMSHIVFSIFDLKLDYPDKR